jgi:hypothetical protein
MALRRPTMLVLLRSSVKIGGSATASMDSALVASASLEAAITDTASMETAVLATASMHPATRGQPSSPALATPRRPYLEEAIADFRLFSLVASAPDIAPSPGASVGTALATAI